MMFRITITILAVLACWKWGDWRRWKDYYPTILYAVIGDLAYNVIFFNHTLWRYENFVNHTISDLFVASIVFPSIIILFLSHWPTTLLKQTVYILSWSIGSTILEYISKLLGFFSYDHGWNVFWSFGVYFGGFLLIRLHMKHPLVVWPISALLAVLTALLFKLPFDAIK